MKDLLKNKKTLIPILLGIAIIVIAIVTFIVIGVTSKKSDSRVSVVRLDNTQATTNELGNTYGNEADNEITNEVDDDENEDEDYENKDFGVDEFYQEAAKKFVKGLSDEDKIQEFVDDYFDPKAYVAYEDANLEDANFLEEYSKLDDNDERIEETTENILLIPGAMVQAEELMDLFSQMANGDENINSTMKDEDGNELDIEDLDFTFILEDISEPEDSEDDENISKITITISCMGEEQDYIMVFYDEVVIYIMTPEGDSFLEGFQTAEE